jgi:hypothetical protein
MCRLAPVSEPADEVDMTFAEVEIGADRLGLRGVISREHAIAIVEKHLRGKHASTGSRHQVLPRFGSI